MCLPGQRDALTPLERITEAGNDGHHDMAAWEPFRNNVDMDEEVCWPSHHKYISLESNIMEYIKLQLLVLTSHDFDLKYISLKSNIMEYIKLHLLVRTSDDFDLFCWDNLLILNNGCDWQEQMLKSLAKGRSKKVECCNVTGSMAAMKAWRSVQRRARDLLRRNSHSQLVESFEVHAILLYAYEFPHYIPIIVKTTPCHSKWETCTGFRIGTFEGSRNRETL